MNITFTAETPSRGEDAFRRFSPRLGACAVRLLSLRILCAALLLAIQLATFRGHGQGALTITFDGPTLQPANTASLVQYYSEAGMWFRPMDSLGFVRYGGGNQNGVYPFNDTAYVQAGLNCDMSFGFDDGSLFGVVSADLARYLDSPPELNVTFVGYHADGSTVTKNVTATLPNDNTFHTWYFGPEWSFGLTRVEIPNYPWSLDNLVVIIPEPATTALLLVGVLAIGLLRLGRRRV
jgi:hypothetical protein